MTRSQSKVLSGLIAVLVTILVVFCLLWSRPALAQTTPPTRVTACSANTAWNAVCLSWAAVTTYSDGVPIVGPVVYNLERSGVATGPWVSLDNSATSTQYLATSLAPGVHYFRVFAVAGTAQSAPSNTASRGVTTGIPSTPVLTIAVVIQRGKGPVVIAVTQPTAKMVGQYDCTRKG